MLVGLALCGQATAATTTTTVTSTTTTPLGIPFTPVKGHPCVPNSATFYMQCAALAPGQVQPPAASFSQFGVDSYTGVSPGINAAFDCSYLPLGSKGWRAYQVHEWTAAGKHTCFVYESYANRAEYGYGAGQADARTALRDMSELGVPSYVPIRFAVDTPASAGGVRMYFLGAKSIVGTRVGAYGSYYVTSGLESAGITTPRADWQTVAWSYGHRSAACLYQSSINHYYDGASVDFDTASCTDWGQYPFNYKPPIICFGKKAAGSKTCRKAHEQVRHWQKAADSSQKAFKARNCPKVTKSLRKLNQRWNWFWLQLQHHPQTKRAKRQRALEATGSAREKAQKQVKKRACVTFSSRIVYFKGKITQIEHKYGSQQKS